MDKPLARKRVAILVAHEYEDIELLCSVLELSEAGGKKANHIAKWRVQ